MDKPQLKLKVRLHNNDLIKIKTIKVISKINILTIIIIIATNQFKYKDRTEITYFNKCKVITETEITYFNRWEMEITYFNKCKVIMETVII